MDSIRPDRSVLAEIVAHGGRLQIFAAICSLSAACNSFPSSRGIPDMAGHESAGEADAGSASQDGSDPGAGEAGATTAAAQYATSYCDKMVDCLGAPLDFPDYPTCLRRTMSLAADIMAAEGTGATVPAMVSCAQARRAASCADWRNISDSACYAMRGSLPDFAPCAYNAQCIGMTCEVGLGSTCGVCQTLKAPGQACSNVVACAAPAVCENGVCVDPDPPGSSCSSTSLCGYPGACVNGVCAPEPLGTPCDPSVWTCPYPSFCSSQSKSCEPYIWAQPGATCGWVNGDSSQWVDCLIGGCAVPQGQLTSTCLIPAKDGEPCDTAAPCIPPAQCNYTGTCVVPLAASCN